MKGEINPALFVNVADLAFEAAVRGLAAQREAMVKDLMGRWVSELEPCIFVQARTGRILGVGAVGHPGPAIAVRYEAAPRPHHFANPDGSVTHLEWPI